MGQLFNIAHELGDLSEYSSTVTDVGDLSVSATAALGSTGYGLLALIDDQIAIYGQKGVVSSAGRLRFRFYLDPNGLTMAGADRFVVAAAYGTLGTLASVYLQRTGANYEVGAQIHNDAGGGSYSAWTVVTDAEHYVEIDLQRASDAVASDGSLEIYIDGVLEDTVAGEDNYDWLADVTHLRLGAVAELDVGTSGTLYLDEFRANDDGSAIGACSNLAAAQTTLGGEPVVTLDVGGETLGTFVVGYRYEEKAQSPGGLTVWLDNRGDEFDNLAVGYPLLVRGAAVDLRRGISVDGAATTEKLPRTWVEDLRYVQMEGGSFLRLYCIDFWGKVNRFRYPTSQTWTNTEVATIANSILGEVGCTLAAGAFGVLVNFDISVRRDADQALKDVMSRVEEYLYAGDDAEVLYKVLDPAEAAGYDYDWSVGGGANHPLLPQTEIAEWSPRFNKIAVVGGIGGDYAGSAEDAVESALVGERLRTINDPDLDSDAKCAERAQAELRYWQAQKTSGTLVARPHFTLRLYDVVSVAAPAYGGPAVATARVTEIVEEYGKLLGHWQQRLTLGRLPMSYVTAWALADGSIGQDGIDESTRLTAKGYQVRSGADVIMYARAEVEEDWGTTCTFETMGKDAAEPEGSLELVAVTHDGAVAGGVATVTLTLDTEAGTVALGGATRMPFGTTYPEMTEQAADPAAPGANRGRVYMRDDGGGNTQLCVRFNTGAIVVLGQEGGGAPDHGLLGGLADVADHPDYLLMDGTRDLTGSQLIIASGAAVVPLTVKGAAAQSANLQEWQDSAGVVKALVTSDGRAAFGQAAMTGTGYALEAAITVSGGVLGIGAGTVVTVDSAIAENATHAGYFGGLEFTGAGNQTKPFATLPGNAAVYGRARIYTAPTITGLKGFVAAVVFRTAAATGTVVDLALFYASNARNSAGAASSVTRQYGFYAEDMTFAGTNYAIYTNVGLVHLGDQVEIIGSAAADVQLTVKGAAAQSANLQEWQDSAGVILTSIISGGDPVVAKTSGRGIRVDTATPTFGWRDLRAEIRTRGGGASDPSDAAYQGNIKAFSFLVNDEAWIEFHIPHDYVAGTDVHLHFHWSHNSAIVTGGNVTWEADVTYAKGHNQAAFPATVNPTLSPDASTTQYQHMVSEVQLSAVDPGAAQIDTDDLEPDGIVLARVYLSANNITSGGAVPDPFLHEVDIHYQSTNIATKQKVPDFWT